MPERTIVEIREDLDKLHSEVGELYKKLDRSIRIQELWPDAFADGLTCTPILVGKNFSRPAQSAPDTTSYPEPYHNVREVVQTFLRRSDGRTYRLNTANFMSIFED